MPLSLRPARAGTALAVGLMVLGVLAPTNTVAADPSLTAVRMATWNLELDNVEAQYLVEALAERAPSIVGLQELTVSQAEVIEADAELWSLYPHRVLDPATDTSGMGLLSTWPLDGTPTLGKAPPSIATTVLLPDAPPLDLVVAHPPPPILGISASAPTYDARLRDRYTAELRELVQTSIDAGRRVVLLGDFNTMDHEVGYRTLARGLTDSHLAAGSGPGNTWRPSSLAGLPFGLLRIDLVLAGPGISPLSSAPDCSPSGSDHCILDVVLGVEQG